MLVHFVSNEAAPLRKYSQAQAHQSGPNGGREIDFDNLFKRNGSTDGENCNNKILTSVWSGRFIIIHYIYIYIQDFNGSLRFAMKSWSKYKFLNFQISIF